MTEKKTLDEYVKKAEKRAYEKGFKDGEHNEAKNHFYLNRLKKEAEERGYKKHEKEILEKGKPWLECLTSEMVDDHSEIEKAREEGKQQEQKRIQKLIDAGIMKLEIISVPQDEAIERIETLTKQETARAIKLIVIKRFALAETMTEYPRLKADILSEIESRYLSGKAGEEKKSSSSITSKNKGTSPAPEKKEENK